MPLLDLAEQWDRVIHKEPFAGSNTARTLMPFVEAIRHIHKPVPWKVRLIILFSGEIPEDYIAQKGEYANSHV